VVCLELPLVGAGLDCSNPNPWSPRIASILRLVLSGKPWLALSLL